MKEQKLIIEFVVGYMLKVLKSGMPITHYKQEFAHIRHGNYYEFIQMFKHVPVAEPTVVYQAGVVTVRTEVQKDDFDFLALMWAGPALKVFYRDCVSHYGFIQDTDIADTTFERAALFEIGLRMHASKYEIDHRGINLETVINQLCTHKGLDLVITETLHKGRHFLNVIKHPEKLNNKFSSWAEGVIAFNEAFAELQHQRFTVM